MKMAIREYMASCNNYSGYCKECDEITRDSTEPDVEGYSCPVCGQDTVMGVELAMVKGLIEVVEIQG